MPDVRSDNISPPSTPSDFGLETKSSQDKGDQNKTLGAAHVAIDESARLQGSKKEQPTQNREVTDITKQKSWFSSLIEGVMSYLHPKPTAPPSFVQSFQTADNKLEENDKKWMDYLKSPPPGDDLIQKYYEDTEFAEFIQHLNQNPSMTPHIVSSWLA